MKQVVQSVRSGKLALRDVPAPQVRRGHILVQTHASLISAGTERMVVDFAKKSLAGKAKARPDLVKQVLNKVRTDGIAATLRTVMAKLDEPLPLGYSAAGEVVAVGEGLEGVFRVGQRVAVAGAGIANHAELNVVPRNLAAPIPDDVSFAQACYGTLGSIALHAVRNLDAKLGETVAIMGVGLLGQLAVQFFTLGGARVVALDYDPSRLELAKKMGAELAVNLAEPGVIDTVLQFTKGRGVDGVLLAAATKSSEPFETGAAIARDRARITMVGLCGTTFPYQTFMKKELNLIVSRSYGPGRYDPDYEGRGVKYPEGWVRWTETENLEEVVRLMGSGLKNRLDVEALTTHTFAADKAEEAYSLVVDGGSEPCLGVVLAYEGREKGEQRLVFPEAKSKPNGCSLGVIGAGGFARAVLLPELRKRKDVRMHTVVTTKGTSAEHAQQAFGFENGVTDIDAVLKNPDINAVLIATRHGTHADFTARALAAGKSVLVEKPLAMNRDELNRIVEARNGSDAFFQVGFNRRFAPMSIKAKNHVIGKPGPKFSLLRINAGHIPGDHWVHSSDDGGGRILGEVCHFIDLARFFVGAEIASVQADAAEVTTGACDDLSVNLRFKDGSLATVAYTALGDTSYSKELYEVYGGGSLAVVNNFRSVKLIADGNANEQSDKMGQDKGFKGSIDAFVEAVKSGGPAPIDEAELIETSLATIAVTESLQTGKRIDL